MKTLYNKVNRRRFIDRQRKGVVVGEEENRIVSRALRSFSRARFARELADVFEKNEKKNKTSSVYRLLTPCSGVARIFQGVRTIFQIQCQPPPPPPPHKSVH